MAPLPRELRQSLERTVVQARAAAEAAARAALATFAVNEDKPHNQMSESDRRLRRALRAKSLQLGNAEALVAEIAYQHWHRMLFARFLAENDLLIYPGSTVAVSLDEVAELAKQEGESDPWLTAARFAAEMLPAIFRTDEPSLHIRFSPEGRQGLESLLTSLPSAVFTAPDTLGWVYQFWQSEKKKEVNKAGKKIGPAELPAVTQLFTEDYMVRFLLENSLGAWWGARHPKSPLVADFAYLRFSDDGTPAAGNFEGWPDRTADVTVMDPCCGSGHFLTAAFEILTAMRMEEEGLIAPHAGDAVIRDNLFGLELDPRCTQIAAFALALAAWKQGGYRKLPAPNIACSGIGVAGQLADWKKLAVGDERLEQGLEALHEQFRNAPELGSLIDPRRATDQGHLFSVPYDDVAPLLEKLLEREDDPETRVAGWAAAGIAHAAALLTRRYNLVSTNVPFLMRGKQQDVLRDFADRHFPNARADLATMFLERVRSLVSPGGCYAVVTPQTWFFLGRYEALRSDVLRQQRLWMAGKLGPGAFEGISGEVVNVALVILGNVAPTSDSHVSAVTAEEAREPIAKAQLLRVAPLALVKQANQLLNPRAVLTFDDPSQSVLLETYASGLGGITTGDSPRFRRNFWELIGVGARWTKQQSTVNQTCLYGGRELLLLWDDGKGALAREGKEGGATIAGRAAWGKCGVAVQKMGDLPVTLYTGEPFENVAVVISPKESAHLPAIWSFCASPEFRAQIRRIDQSLGVTANTVVKVPFDLEHWQKLADQQYPDGLPQPQSTDPTQWLYRGNPTESSEPLQVAVARLLGYRWPDQNADALDEFADSDGVVCIPAVAGEAPAAERLRMLLNRAWERFSPTVLEDLLAQAGAPGKDIEAWLRDDFFAAHARVFHNRPFIWHIWDGRRDGFSALVNYHRLDQQLLNRINFTLLGGWIELQRDQVKRDLPGAEGRLIAAQELQRKLELIAHGEPPYDIYVRWKSLAEQPIGWEPDLNDGVRLNIRPFIVAGILRSKVTINWNTDRGREPDGKERHNNVPLSRADKEVARRSAERVTA